jgi:pimeloyl-ACP methyl ester carboxylesterase
MMRFTFGLFLLVLLAAISTAIAAEPASQPAVDGRFIAYPNGTPDLRSPGFHKLIYEWNDGGHARQIRFSLFLPHGYGTDHRRWPMVTFLAGLGDRGDDPGNAMAVGVPLEIGRSAELGQWMPMMILSPQCPGDKQWDSPGMGEDIVRLINAVANQFAVDSARLYATGFSDGGKGTWVLASLAPRLFAAVAPVVSREYQAQQTADRLAGTGTSLLVISGLKDEKSEPASSHMVAALRAKNVNVAYAPVPNANHFIWRAFFSQRRFYEWLLLHHRDGPPVDDLHSGESFVAMYQSNQQLSLGEQMFDYGMQRDLDRFEPYWFVDNCGQSPIAGFKLKILDRKDIYVTVPLTADIPCRLQTTRQLPADKLTTLQLEVGHPPRTEWELVIRVNEQEQSRTLVNDQTAPDGWLPVKLDLHSFAGGEARLQLIHNAAGRRLTAGYWASVKLVETAPDAGGK